jgi:hypothetical protein
MGEMRGAVVACVLAGCYSPLPLEGVPCSSLGECPTGLACVDGECRRDALPGDAPADAEGADAAAGCIAPSLPQFGQPILDAELSSSSFDGTPTLSSNEREMFFKSERAGGLGGVDIWRSTRSSSAAAWSVPVPVVELNSIDSDESPELASDGLTLWLTSNRDGNRDIYFATRPNVESSWTAPVRIPELSSPGSDEGLFVSASQLVAYLHSDRDSNGSGMRLYRSTRASLDDAWSTPVRVVELDAGLTAENPWLTADDCTMYFHTGTELEQAIVFTTRTTDGTFGPLTTLTTIDAAGIDADPWLAADQRTIVWASNRAGGVGSFDLYVATR